MSKEELLQIVDPSTGEPTGELVPRSVFHEKKLWGRSTNVFVLNAKGHLLCSRRQLDKEYYPGAWSTHFGGHIVQGESFKIGAMKELEEEIGIKADPLKLLPWRTSKIASARLWARDFVTLFDGDTEDLVFQESEIMEIRWVAPQEILEYLDAEGSHFENPNALWLAGTHDFNADYQCMRAVLTAAIDIGVFDKDYKPLHKWHPPKQDPTA
jgi:isopentenyldiphosphate isomerase